ncbi:hypothetical protein OJF2_78940 (plasmid) [Aquisphaera giovannonii]|uniref:Uncharacterized protein n=1 Tax=Aquisphaera giovannonii TaxID=406548 RepID=A0A5B9WG82_9BACT|nr:hypothetical protein [Aquisphaera giovannonii]QEH39279.1 hypothetical protein OJF2_78940 [Aquisphaera giovannonii]
MSSTVTEAEVQDGTRVMVGRKLSEVYIWIDKVTHQPVELSENYSLEGYHHPPDDPVLDSAAVGALTRKAQAIIQAWNQSPSDPNHYNFYGVRLLRRENEWSHTHHNPVTGENNWEGGGTGVGNLLYTIG